jgi:protein subunit release factor A
MRDSVQEVRVSLTVAADSAAFFLADICGMLRAIASRSEDSLAAFQARSSSSDSDDAKRAALRAPASPALRHEVGLHRAQFVPQGTSAGRVETVNVRVDILNANDDEAEPSFAELVRTYNYPLRTCTDHRSGRTASLDDVLSGRAD